MCIKQTGAVTLSRFGFSQHPLNFRYDRHRSPVAGINSLRPAVKRVRFDIADIRLNDDIGL